MYGHTKHYKLHWSNIMLVQLFKNPNAFNTPVEKMVIDFLLQYYLWQSGSSLRYAAADTVGRVLELNTFQLTSRILLWINKVKDKYPKYKWLN